MRRIPLLVAGLLLGSLLATPAVASLPPSPNIWPHRLQLGVADGPGGAADLRNDAPFRFRYQYLAGGVNTGGGWATWNEDGRFVTHYIEESRAHGFVPVFTYYMIRQSLPGANSGEADGVFENLNNRDTMRAYYEDLMLFYERAGAFDATVVLHVEPDMWGFMEQRAGDGPAASVPVEVSSTGLDALEGLPNNLSGFARAVVRLRNRLAPNVILGYHLSVWGTMVDIAYSDPPGEEIDALAAEAATFYRSLDAKFDLSFAEFSDRDAAFKEHVYGDGGASWWKAADFARNARFLRGFVRGAGTRIVMWQIPLGNTIMRAMDNTWGHYQDNRVQWLLGRFWRDHLRSYRRSGVVAFLFGGGAAGTTCACDATGDGVTNPPPINGNDRMSIDSDDDGGYFKFRARKYYRRGTLRLP